MLNVRQKPDCLPNRLHQEPKEKKVLKRTGTWLVQKIRHESRSPWKRSRGTFSGTVIGIRTSSSGSVILSVPVGDVILTEFTIINIIGPIYFFLLETGQLMKCNQFTGLNGRTQSHNATTYKRGLSKLKLKIFVIYLLISTGAAVDGFSSNLAKI